MFDFYSEGQKISIENKKTIHNDILDNLIDSEVTNNKEIKTLITEMKTNTTNLLLSTDYKKDNIILVHKRVLSLLETFSDTTITIKEILSEIELFLSAYDFEEVKK